MNNKRLLARFLSYVTCDSESGNELQFCNMIENELKKLGLEVWRDEIGHLCNSNGYNVHAFLSGIGEPILFNAHLDTASPGKNIVPVIENGIIKPSGKTILGGDDKAGIAAVMEALETHIENGIAHRPIEVFFSIREESGMLGSQHADYSKMRSKEALVLDGDVNACIVNQVAGIIQLHIEIFGKGAHFALCPENGIDALKAAIAVVNRILMGFMDSNDSVINIYNFTIPGESNMVPEYASFFIELRCFTTELIKTRKDYIENAVHEGCKLVPGISYKIEQIFSHDVLFVEQDNTLLLRLRDVCQSIGEPFKLVRTFASSDAANLVKNGITAVDYGIGMTNVHTTEEIFAVKDLERTGIIVERMMDTV